MEPLIVARQGSFMAGGRVGTSGEDTVRGDHVYAQFQIPVSPRHFPLILDHGGSTSGVGWESTPDGREGFQTLLLRRGFSTYVIDRPRKGRAGASFVGGTTETLPMGDEFPWNIWRLGIWAPPQPRSFFPNLQLPTDDETIDQFLRQRTPTTGPILEREDMSVALDAMDALLAKVGDSVLVLHSDAGRHGWITRTRNDHVVGIVAYEPGTYVFPNDDPPEVVPTATPFVARVTQPILVPRHEFLRLTQIPIQIVFGDNISEEPSTNVGIELWRTIFQRVRQFQSAVNACGGHVEILDLPTVGLLGNTHFPFSDLNNHEVAELLVDYLERWQLA